MTFCCKFSRLAFFVASLHVGNATPLRFTYLLKDREQTFVFSSNFELTKRGMFFKESNQPWREEIQTGGCQIHVKQRLVQILNLYLVLAQVILLEGFEIFVRELAPRAQRSTNFGNVEVLGGTGKRKVIQ
jgi:hypothetical protein